MPKPSFENRYPSITRWLYEHQGVIEIGTDSNSPLTSFIRAIDMGGMVWEGDDDYEQLDDAFLDLEVNIDIYLKELYGD